MAVATNSGLGMALAGKSASVDIPKPREGAFAAGRDSFTAVSANPLSKKHGMLPTPPNSLSPNLPPHRRDSGSNPSRSSPPGVLMESDIDLHDGEHDKMHTLSESVLNAESLDRLGDLDSAGAITPGLLAKHHLPDILLSHGPLAIRHIMGYLTTSVPGFSRITSAKARRLVVAALEGRGAVRRVVASTVMCYLRKSAGVVGMLVSRATLHASPTMAVSLRQAASLPRTPKAVYKPHTIVPVDLINWEQA